jgi:hypothetical protein
MHTSLQIEFRFVGDDEDDTGRSDSYTDASGLYDSRSDSSGSVVARACDDRCALS